jgi:DNA-binding FadR family transcriptional regulator
MVRKGTARGRTKSTDVPVGHRRTEKLSEVLAREIVRDIRNLPPSTMLPSEAIMLEKYGVGRASLREALRLLEVQGLVVIRPGPGGGPMVAQVDSIHYGRISSLYYHMSDATYQDVVDARLVMEPMIARLVAERHDREIIKQLQTYLDTHAAADYADGTDYQVEDASGFHVMLVGMSGNPVLNLTARSLQEVLLHRTHGLFPPDAQRRIEQDHANIARAVIKGDAARAERLMRTHMLQYVEYSKKRYPGVLDETVDWQ